MKETALGERAAVLRALIYRGLTLAAAVICQHNFCVMARTLLTVENSFCVMCLIASSVPHRANRYFQVIDAIRRKFVFAFVFIHHWRSLLHLRSHRFGSLKPIVRDAANVGSQRVRRALCL
jgi:hypothetical protein